MSAAGFTPIQLYRSTTASAAPTAGNLADGELAINTNDGKLYYKDSSGVVQLIASKAGASGDVVGPASATDNAIVRFDGTTGKLVQNSVVTIADSTGDISGVGQLNATTVDATNVEVTNIKAKDGTAAASIADSTGVVSITANPILSGGTANGVLYLNGSKVATSGSALTFNGSSLTQTANSSELYLAGGSSAAQGGFLAISRGGTNKIFIGTASNVIGGGSNTSDDLALVATADTRFFASNAEQMRLTSTGLGIGTSSPGYKLDVRVSPAAGGAAGAGVTTGSYEATLLVTGSTYNNYGVGANSAWLYTATNDLAIGPYGGSGIVKVVTGGATRATFDSSGNLGLGVTPSAWEAGWNPIQGAGYSLANGNAVQMWLGSNWYYNAGNKYRGTGLAALYQQSSGVHSWYNAPSGTAGNTISFTQALTLDASGNLLLNGTSAPASSAGNLVMFNGTAPTGNVTNGCTLFCEDVSSSSELKVRDEAGNVTTLSPHNFSLIPEGPSEDMAWSYYSERDGRRINIDMLKAIRLLEKISGEQLVYES